MKILSDEGISQALESRYGTDHGRFVYVAEAQHKDTLRQVRELLDGMENPYSSLFGVTIFDAAIQAMKALLEANSKNAEKRHCSECNWEGLEDETGFGHDDFYCPICLKETLDICEVKQ